MGDDLRDWRNYFVVSLCVCVCVCVCCVELVELNCDMYREEAYRVSRTVLLPHWRKD